MTIENRILDISIINANKRTFIIFGLLFINEKNLVDFL